MSIPALGPPICLVFLRRRACVMELESVRSAVAKGFGLLVQDAELAVMALPKQPGQFLVRTGLTSLLVVNVDQSYSNDMGGALDATRDSQAEFAMQEHTGWMSIGWIGLVPFKDAEEPYRHIGKLAAQLLNKDFSAVISPIHKKINSFGPEMLPILSGPNPLSVLSMERVVPIINIQHDNTEMANAVAEAKRRWPEFLAAFENRYFLQRFAVKVPFNTDSDGKEFMWVKVKRIDGSAIYGRLANEPKSVKRLKVKDKVTVSLDDLNDWIYSNGRQMVGGFTAQVLQDQE